MATRLCVGAGPSSDYEYQIDQVKFPRTTHVFDIVNTPWPFEDNFFDEVRMSQVLEHIPPVVYFKEKNGKFDHIYARVRILKEIYRILKPGGFVEISVPAEQLAFSQDPTHTGPMPIEGFLNYYCGQWGGNKPGDFATDAYGINFEFHKIAEYRTNEVLTIKLQK